MLQTSSKYRRWKDKRLILQSKIAHVLLLIPKMWQRRFGIWRMNICACTERSLAAVCDVTGVDWPVETVNHFELASQVFFVEMGQHSGVHQAFHKCCPILRKTQRGKPVVSDPLVIHFPERQSLQIRRGAYSQHSGLPSPTILGSTICITSDKTVKKGKWIDFFNHLNFCTQNCNENIKLIFLELIASRFRFDS